MSTRILAWLSSRRNKEQHSAACVPAKRATSNPEWQTSARNPLSIVHPSSNHAPHATKTSSRPLLAHSQLPALLGNDFLSEAAQTSSCFPGNKIQRMVQNAATALLNSTGPAGQLCVAAAGQPQAPGGHSHLRKQCSRPPRCPTQSTPIPGHVFIAMWSQCCHSPPCKCSKLVLSPRRRRSREAASQPCSTRRTARASAPAAPTNQRSARHVGR